MATEKFALFEYDTENIGDEVQSIAARRFLPQVDYYVNRDKLNEFKASEPAKIIMNGWYSRNPKSWPPRKDSNLDPLFVSMHVSLKDEAVVKAFLSPKSVELLRASGPVGARDETTKQFFDDNDIPAYFSGCVTLTLQRDPDIKKQDFILAVDAPKKVVDAIKQRTKRPVIELSVYHFPYLSREDRFFVAEYILGLYQSAAAVVTTRLHAMLPSLAFETPVLLIKDSKKYEPKRYTGLAELVRSATEKEFIASPEVFDIDSPTANPPAYKKIRENLIKTCSKFTGFNNAKTYRTVQLDNNMFDLRFIRAFTFGWSSTFPKALLEGDVAWAKRQNRDLKKVLKKADSARADLERTLDDKNKENDSLRGEIGALRKELSEIYQSKSWRYTEPLRKLMNVRSNKK